MHIIIAQCDLKQNQFIKIKLITDAHAKCN